MLEVVLDAVPFFLLGFVSIVALWQLEVWHGDVE